MKHLLAYGNSDQSSFRDPVVRGSFDIMTVPGTIAAYYAEATAAFVLSSELEYLIDPRTPLFQGVIREPRASHLSLANVLSEQLVDSFNRADNQVTFSAGFYTPAVIEELVEGTLKFQRDYGGRANQIQTKLERYQRLLAEAKGEFAIYNNIQDGRPPAFVLAPYFVSGVDDEWDLVTREIWDRCALDAGHAKVSAVVASLSIDVLDRKLRSIPDDLSATTFFWVNAFDERKMLERDLRSLWGVVADWAGRRRLINMYGGFYSICLHYAGLWGFSNGLGYSESRDWPELPTTGAAPARYYVPRLHAYASQASAQLLVDRAPSFKCSCEVCTGRSVVELTYFDLKRHFALTRRSEIVAVQELEPVEMAERLESAFADYSAAAEELPRGFGVPVSHLLRWAAVLKRPS